MKYTARVAQARLRYQYAALGLPVLSTIPQPAEPFPATVSMIPASKSTRRMRWFSVSAM